MFYVNKPVFDRFYTDYDKERLFKEIPRIDVKRIGSRVINFSKSKTRKASQLLDGMNFNYVPAGGRVSSMSDK